MQPVTDPDLLAILNGGAPASGGPVYGPPPEAPEAPTPFQVEDQNIQRENARRAQLEWDAKHNPDGSLKPEAAAADGAASEGERNNGAYYERALRALQTYDTIGLGPRSYAGSTIAAIPYVGEPALRMMPDSVGDSPERQNSEQAKRDFATIILRSDSGANAPEAEVERLVSTYFPSAGETDPAVLANYAAARVAALEGIRQKAGRLAAGLPSYSPPAAETETNSDPQADEFSEGFDPDSGLRVRVTDDSPAAPISLGPDGKPRITGNDPGFAQFAAGVGDLVQGGLNNTIGLLANPVNTNLFRALGYDNYTSDIGATAREGLGLPYGNESIEAVNQAAAGGLGGAGVARGLAGMVYPGLARTALAEYGARPTLDAVTGGAAALSGEGARQAGAGPVGQTLATLIGGAVPSTLASPGTLASLASRGSRPPADFDAAVVQAGQRQDVPIRMGDAVPSQRDAVANLETTPRGGPVIQQGRAADTDRIEQRVAEIGGGGEASDPYALGQRVQAAGTRNIERTRTVKNNMYTAAERLANGQRVVPGGAIAAVDRNIAELEAQGQNANQALLGYLRGLREDLSKPDGFSITEFQGLRSNSGKKIKGDQALTVTDADRRLGEVAQAFTADASEQLPDAASNALARADQYYSERQDFIQQVLRPLMGTPGQPVPAERAAERLISMTRGKGDYQRFARMWSELAEDERADVAGTIAQSLGRKANGEFSPATLLRSLDPRSGINPRTARLIFGEDGASALADLRAIAEAKTGAAAQLNNSRTGNMISRGIGGLKTLITSLIGYSAGGATGAVALPVARSFFSQWGEERAARALMNPDFTRWLRNAPDTNNPQVLSAYFKRLEIAAAKSPILANDIQGFREAANDALAASPGSLAAQEQENN